MRKSKLALALGLVCAIAVGTWTYAKPPRPGGGGCPKDILCFDLWDPVVCANGVTYSNQCYADRACAPGPCTPAGGGPVEVE